MYQISKCTLECESFTYIKPLCMYHFSPPPLSPPLPLPVPTTHTFLFFSSALCLFLCLRRGKVLLWYDVAPELLCPLPYAAASPTEVACCCELLLMASPGLLAGPGLRLSGVTDKRSPVELRLEYVCVHVCMQVCVRKCVCMCVCKCVCMCVYV